jgi:hypothetical protein
VGCRRLLMGLNSLSSMKKCWSSKGHGLNAYSVTLAIKPQQPNSNMNPIHYVLVLGTTPEEVAAGGLG